MQFKGTSPCNTCPYRKDVKLQYWAKEEFVDLLVEDKKQLGKVYGCHKSDDTICRGYLINQDKRYFPNINLRLYLSKYKVTREYLDKLKCKVPMYESIEEMAKVNYSEIKM